MAALAQRIIDDGDVITENRLAEAVLQKAGAARDGRPVDGPQQVPDEASGHALVIDHRHRL